MDKLIQTNISLTLKEHNKLVRKVKQLKTQGDKKASIASLIRESVNAYLPDPTEPEISPNLQRLQPERKTTIIVDENDPFKALTELKLKYIEGRF